MTKVSRLLVIKLPASASRLDCLHLRKKVEYPASFVPAPATLVALVASVVREHLVFVTIGLGYVSGVIGVGYAIGRPNAVSFSLYSPMIALLPAGLLALAVGHALYVSLILRPESPLKRIAEDWGHRFRVPERIIVALPVLLVLPLFISAFTSMKIMIPLLNPFSWDVAFTRWDRWLHGGFEPWRLLHPALGYPAITAALNFFYVKWFLVLYAILLWQTFSLRDPHLRQQYLIAFLLSWILLGTVMPLLVPAAGPCYYGRVTGLEDPYRPLMTYLANVHREGLNPAFQVQEWLWTQYGSGKLVSGAGISAMPSMHVALSTLFMLLGFRLNRLLGWLMAFFVVSILLGSVHLGWHYALDGYFAIGLVPLIWKLAGAMASLQQHDQEIKISIVAC